MYDSVCRHTVHYWLISSIVDFQKELCVFLFLSLYISSMSFECKRCKNLGLKQFLTEFDKEKIEKQIIERENVKKTIQRNLEKYLPIFKSSKDFKNQCFLMGNACSTPILSEAIDILVKRDYPQIYDILHHKHIGQIFVPQLFLTNSPKIVDPDKLEGKIAR